jgi:UDP-N-acetylglucosamine/UDP-N-acetylgalactosamine diphosphorylase
MTDQATRFAAWKQRLEQHGQAHVLTWWDQLSDSERGELLDDLDQIDLERCTPLLDAYVRRRPVLETPGRIEPAAILPAVPPAELRATYAEARAAGEAAIRAGRVAAFTVAGGQGTRLGYEGPKGCFPISPIRNAPLFQLFAEYLLGVERRYGRRPRWYLMTSPGNHAQTVAYFESQGFFGLSPAEVIFFRQGQMPAFLPDGRIALAERGRLALAPDGHGGSLQALRASGALEDMRRHGIDQISYFQVDNPLVHAIDPLFVGLHLLRNSEMSSKAVTKAGDLERVGNFCLVDGRLQVIEYSDLPEELARERNPDGTRRFDAGSIAIHVMSRDFVERLTAPGARIQLPWHRADKKVATVEEPEPAAPNAVKLEMFVFDAIPLAREPFVLYTERAEEFSPVKNAEGADSPATARRDQVRRAARWLNALGAAVPCSGDGDPPCPLEISPRFAINADDFADRVGRQPRIALDGPRLWE